MPPSAETPCACRPVSLLLYAWPRTCIIASGRQRDTTSSCQSSCFLQPDGMRGVVKWRPQCVPGARWSNSQHRSKATVLLPWCASSLFEHELGYSRASETNVPLLILICAAQEVTCASQRRCSRPAAQEIMQGTSCSPEQLPVSVATPA